MKTGVYKTVYADLWDMEWFLDFTMEEKIVFLNILTSRYNRQIGVYLPAARMQALQCGLSKQEWDSIVDGFVRRNILMRSSETGEIAIPSYLVEHFGKGGPPALQLLSNEAGSVKDSSFLTHSMQQNLKEAMSRRDLHVNGTLRSFLLTFDAHADRPSGMDDLSESDAAAAASAAEPVMQCDATFAGTESLGFVTDDLDGGNGFDDAHTDMLAEEEPAAVYEDDLTMTDSPDFFAEEPAAEDISEPIPAPPQARPWHTEATDRINMLLENLHTSDQTVPQPEPTPKKEQSTLTVDSICDLGHYRGKHKSYLQIAHQDPSYAQWWAEKTDVKNPIIRELFQKALSLLQKGGSITDVQKECFFTEYPRDYQTDNMGELLSQLSSEEAIRMLSFLRDCNIWQWPHVESIPSADAFIQSWPAMREKALHDGHYLYGYIEF